MRRNYRKEEYFIGCQCKYIDQEWKPNTLASNYIIKNALIFLSQNDKNIYRLVTRTNCTKLVDLISEAQKFQTVQEFEHFMAKSNVEYYKGIKLEIEKETDLELFLAFMDTPSFRNNPWSWYHIVEKLKKENMVIKKSIEIIDKLCNILICSPTSDRTIYNDGIKSILEDIIKKFTDEDNLSNMDKYLNYNDCLLEKMVI